MFFYSADITEIGVEALEEEGLIVLFRDDAPSDLRPYCILHNGNKLQKDIQKGLTLCLGNHSFPISAVGDLVNKNLNDLGHITIHFNGNTTPDNPGDICVLGKKPAINVGDKIQIKE